MVQDIYHGLQLGEPISSTETTAIETISHQFSKGGIDVISAMFVSVADRFGRLRFYINVNYVSYDVYKNYYSNTKKDLHH